MKLITTILFVTVLLPNFGLLATQESELRLDPSILAEVDEFLVVARKMAETVDLKKLPHLSSDRRQRIEFCTTSIIQHAELGHTLVSTLRELRSLSNAFLLLQLVGNVEELGSTLATQLFEAAKDVSEHKVEDSESVLDQARQSMALLEEANTARTLATDATEAYLPFKKIPGDLAVAVGGAARAADIALDACLEE